MNLHRSLAIYLIASASDTMYICEGGKKETIEMTSAPCPALYTDLHISLLFDCELKRRTVCLVSPCVLLADVEVRYPRQNHSKERMRMDQQTEARDMPIILLSYWLE